MLNYQTFQRLLLFALLANLCGCTIPKKHDLRNISSFKQSDCAIIKSDALLILKNITDKNLNPAILKIHGGNRNMISEAIGNYSFKLEKGTVLKIKQIETFWDFENGDRLTIHGSVIYDSKETPFKYEDFFNDEPSSINFIKNTFESC